MRLKILWAEVKKETGKWKSRWKIRDLVADGRCTQAVLDFLTATDVERIVLAVEDAGSEAPEWELHEGRELEAEWDFFFFFFCLIILAFDLSRSWRRTFCPVFPSAVRAVAAHCKLPFLPSAQACPKKM